MADDTALRQQLVELLDSGNAHITFADAVREFPVESVGVRPTGSPHSAWELLEHMRIALHDIVAFSGAVGMRYVELDWPADYWPSSPAPAQPADWTRSVDAIRHDLDAFIALLRDPARDLSDPFEWGQGQTLLREALLIADHNAYHLGQLMLIRRMLESGPGT